MGKRLFHVCEFVYYDLSLFEYRVRLKWTKVGWIILPWSQSQNSLCDISVGKNFDKKRCMISSSILFAQFRYRLLYCYCIYITCVKFLKVLKLLERHWWPSDEAYSKAEKCQRIPKRTQNIWGNFSGFSWFVPLCMYIKCLFKKLDDCHNFRLCLMSKSQSDNHRKPPR